MSDEFSIMEKRDEQQILAELQGNFLKKFVYQFKQGKQTVTGISWAGIKEIGFRLGIKTEIEKDISDDNEYTFVMRATNPETKASLLGVGSCKRSQAFAVQKALSKGQRNAIRAVIPEATIEMYLTEFTQKKDHIDEIPDADEIKRQVAVEFKEKIEENKKLLNDLPVWGGVLGVSEVQAYLTECGFPGEQFKVRHDEPTRMYIIDKAPFVQDFEKLKNVVFEMGGEYDRDHKKTVFKY